MLRRPPVNDGLRVPAPSASATATGIVSVGLAVPRPVVSNASIAARLTVDEEWIVSRTGIRERHMADGDERLADLAAAAGAVALARAGMGGGELDLLLVATGTQDDIIPNAAPLVAHHLHASHAAAIDIGAACTGWLSALALATAQIEAGRAQTGLVIGADLMTRFLDFDDPRTAGLFGDGAGAVVVRATDPPTRIGPIVLRSDGSGAEFIVVRRDEGKVRLEGHDTFKHAVTRLAEATQMALKQTGLRREDIDLFVYHQANGRILRAVGARLGLPPERIVDCVGRYGNTSAGSIPIALAEAEADGRLRYGTRVLIAAFGAGLTWGATVIEWGVVPYA